MDEETFEYPEWYKAADERFYRETTSPEFDETHASLSNRAGVGLFKGNLQPLADYLKSIYCPLEPDLALELVSMIEGDGQFADFILDVKKHPKFSRQSQTLTAKLDKRNREQEVGFFIVKQGGLKEGNHDAAIMEAMNEFSLGRSRIETHWQSFLKAMERKIEKDIGFENILTKDQLRTILKIRTDELLRARELGSILDKLQY